MQTVVEHPIEQLQPVYFFAGLLSLIASFFVLTGFFVIPEIREKLAMQIVSIMAVCSVGLSLKYFIPSAKHQLYCYPQHSCNIEAFIGHFFATAIVCWYGVIFINSFRALYGCDMTNAKSTMLWSHAFIWIFSFSSSLLCLNMEQFGMSEDGTCWVTGDRNPFRLLFFVPLTICIFASFAILIIIFGRVIKITDLRQENHLPKAAHRRMASFPGIFLATWIYPFLVAIFQWFGVKRSNILFILYAAAIPGQGAFSFILWISCPLLLPGIIAIEEETIPDVSRPYSSIDSSQLTESTIQEYYPPTSSSVPFRYSPGRESFLKSTSTEWGSKRHKLKQNNFFAG